MDASISYLSLSSCPWVRISFSYIKKDLYIYIHIYIWSCPQFQLKLLKSLDFLTHRSAFCYPSGPRGAAANM